ncbi:MAG: hypothetical protein JWM53_5399 [bacterium]|nr:hypothetical protein [bacterium]
MSSGGPVFTVAAGLLVVSACTSASNVAPYVQPTAAALSVAVGTDPPVRSDGTVPRNARFIVQLDGSPDPDSIGFGPLTLHSGRGNFDIGLAVDLVGRAIVVTPRSLLAPGAQYDLVVSGLVTLDDRVQDADVVASVRVGQDDGDPFPAAPRPTWNGDPVTGGGVRATLGTCAPFCHSPVGASGRVRTPTRALDLTGDPRDPTFGLIGVQSVGLRGTPVPLLRVAPGDPSRSVLLRKLIGGSPQADSIDPPYPNMRVDGRRMPIPLDESQPADIQLSDEELRRVQDWIAAGAPID